MPVAGYGTPVLFFVVPEGNKRKVSAAALESMEKELIKYALKKNDMLCNIQHTKNLPKWSIKGVIRSGQGKQTKAAQHFKKMMGLK